MISILAVVFYYFHALVSYPVVIHDLLSSISLLVPACTCVHESNWWLRLDVPCMLAESGTQGPSVLVRLVESEFCLSQVTCVPIPVAFGLVPGRLDWILLWSLFPIELPLEKP